MAICFNCDMEVTVKADGRPVAIERCPICGSHLCTCPEEPEEADDHLPGCPYAERRRAANEKEE